MLIMSELRLRKYHLKIVSVFIILFNATCSCAQFSGGQGRGDSSVVLSSQLLFENAPYLGGSGDGDNSLLTDTLSFFTLWEIMQNNRVVSRNTLIRARMANFITASSNIPTGNQTIKKLDSSTYTLSTLQPGLMAGMVSKTPNQQLIRGDFRSILINTAAGQTATNCNNTTGSFTQLLWLDQDQLVAGTTKCYTDKTLTTLYTPVDINSWYNIRNGGAVKINNLGVVTEVYCY